MGNTQSGDSPRPGEQKRIRYDIDFEGRSRRFDVDEKYEFKNKLGSGAYGYVCAFKDKSQAPGAEDVAIKKITKVFSQSKLTAERVLRELRLLRQIKHPFIVPMTDVLLPSDTERFDDLYVVYEKMDTTLYRVLRDRTAQSGLQPSFYKRVMYQVLTALQYLHAANVLHRDLSPSNILLSECREKAKICDFGLARTFSDEMTQLVVTVPYRAPELFCSHSRNGRCSYTPAIDIWALGCIFAEMLQPVTRGKTLFDLNDSGSRFQQLEKILEVIPKPSPDDTLEFIQDGTDRYFFRKHFGNAPRKTSLRSLLFGVEDVALDLLEKMLTFNPSKRITAAEALGHPYFQDLAAEDQGGINNHTIEDIHEEEIKSKDIQQLRQLVYKEIVLFRVGIWKKQNNQKR